MSNPVWTMERANLYCGTSATDNTASNHLILIDVKLPAFDKNYGEHRPGGAPVAIEVPLQFNRLEANFTLLGLTPQVMKLIGSWSDKQLWYWVFGNIRDQVTGEEAQAAALLKGTLGRADPANWTPNAAHNVAYGIRSIWHYEFQIAGDPIYYYDFAENAFIVGGVNRNLNMNANLGVPGAEVIAGLGITRGFAPGV